jgi:hypothetical protein
MRKAILLTCLFLLPITPSYSADLSDLESAVIIRALYVVRICWTEWLSKLRWCSGSFCWI